MKGKLKNLGCLSLFIRKKMLFIMVYMILAIASMLVYGNGPNGGMLSGGGNFRLLFFYEHLDLGINGSNYMLMVLFLPSLYSVDCLINRKNGFASMEKTRIGFRAYMKRSIIQCFLSAFLVVGTLLVLKIIVICLVYGPIAFSSEVKDVNDICRLLSSNEFVNLILYIFCTAGGAGIFSLFLYSLQSFIKNPYVLRFSGIVLGIVLYMGPVLVAGLLTGANVGLINDSISAVFDIGNLINPGSLSLSSIYVPSMVAFLLSAVFYSAITALLLRKLYREEKQYG